MRSFILTVSICFACMHTSIAQQCCPYLDYVYVLPTNPDDNDTISIYFGATTPNMGANLGYSYNIVNNTITILACYYSGSLTALQSYHDTLHLDPVLEGTYSVHYIAQQSSDPDNCVASSSQDSIISFTVSAGCNPPTLSYEVEGPSCYGGYASITLITSGGTPPYTFLWNDGTTSEDVEVFAGTYSVTVTDALGCTDEQEVVITDPPITVFVTLTSTPDYNGSPNCNGTITATVSGGTPPYDILWSNGMTETDSLCEGWYIVTVTDSEGCKYTDSVFVDFFVGIDNILENDLVKIFPNPCHDECMIESRSNITSIHVIDLVGRTLVSNYFQSEHKVALNVSGLGSGVYFLRTRNSQGNSHLSRLIKY
jgi:hypothetical protein